MTTAEHDRLRRIELHMAAVTARCPDPRAERRYRWLMTWHRDATAGGAIDSATMPPPDLGDDGEPQRDPRTLSESVAAFERELTEASDADIADLRRRIADALADLYRPTAPPHVAGGLLNAIEPGMFPLVNWAGPLWDAAIHEAAHVVAAHRSGARIESAIARRDGTGLARFAGAYRLDAMDRAAIAVAGAVGEAAPLQTGAGTDGATLEQTGVDRDAAERRATQLLGTVDGLPEQTVFAVGRLIALNAGREVSGADMAFVIDYTEGRFPDLRDDLRRRWRERQQFGRAFA